MITLNLTKNFTPFGGGVDFVNGSFPSGCELNIRIPESCFNPRFEENMGPKFDGRVVVTVRVSSSDDIMRIMLIADALHRMNEVKEIYLFLPFLPYARQDHIVAPGEALSLKVFARMINSCGFDQVEVFDPHSDVTAALIDNVLVHSNLALVKKVLEGKKGYWLVSPDAGAYKKIGKLADQLGYDRQIISCGKVRDPNPANKGKILGMDVPHAERNGEDVYIIDDICEGGRTFVTLATLLRKQNVGRIYLIVSHAVMSSGDLELRKYLDGVFTTDSFVRIGQTDPEFVKEIKLCSIL
jgi:ribose-phosphate pyrophosphokinase